MVAYDNPLWLGIGWGQDVQVVGSMPGDIFRFTFRRSIPGSPAYRLPPIEVDEDDVLRIRIDGTVTGTWEPGLYRWQAILTRGDASAVVGGFPDIPAGPPLGGAVIADDPLSVMASEPLVITGDIGSGAQGIALTLLKSLRGDNGQDGASFQFVQASPSSTWTIAHNLGFRPSVSLFTQSNRAMEADVFHLSENVVVVEFLVPVAGSAHLV